MIANPDGRTLSDLRLAYFLAGLDGALPGGGGSSGPVSVPGGITATGTPSATTYLRGDGSWATPVDTNTTYSAITQANAESAASTAAGLVTGQRIAQAIAASATVAAKLGSPNSSVSGVALYATVGDLPATGQAGVLYFVDQV
ncbi:hypothetical protein QEH45_gp27 [Microbacterium phage Shocker]|uniref:Uncharacterized protein n=1 Tax=Microbacterium phage Shocker TaxID=2805839 RepID=A0A890V1V4_9CAUD|nr:hypothetical protein QEH45_gp27 [Microbacterium phage Shocker]QRI45081.1 hypothetical protein SEA_SHOCKER_27 [Microbacterium phage Shocker]